MASMPKRDSSKTLVEALMSERKHHYDAHYNTPAWIG